MNKKLLAGILAIVVIIVVAYFWFRSPTLPKVAVSRVYNVTESDTLEVNITVYDVSDLDRWAVNLRWNPDILQITTGDPHGLEKRGTHYNIYEGPFLKDVRGTIMLVNDINNNQGTITFLTAGYLESGETPSGTGVLATINFTVIDTGSSAIEITGPSVKYPGQSILQDSEGEEIAHEDIDGLVTDEKK